MVYIIREAETKDIKMIEELYKVLVPTSKNIKVTSQRIAEIKQNKNNFLFVIDVDDIVSGTAFLTLCLDPMFDTRPYAIVENIIISEELRGKNLGKRLMEHIEQFCTHNECTKIMLLSSVMRTEAHQFFRHRGYNDNISMGFKKYL
jgi:N-acetylglutamate synthase-like GNAT family acetyltransferase